MEYFSCPSHSYTQFRCEMDAFATLSEHMMSSGVRSTNVSVLRESMLSNKLILAEVFDSYIKNRIVSDEMNDSRLGRSKTDIDILPFSLEELIDKINPNHLKRSIKQKNTYLYWPFLLNAQQSPYWLVTGWNKLEHSTNLPSN